MNVLNKGSLFRRYAVVGIHSDGSWSANTGYFFSLKSALADAGYFATVISYQVFVWNALNGAWYPVILVPRRK